jgi:hypothetical protein
VVAALILFLGVAAINATGASASEARYSAEARCCCSWVGLE